jgi:hypothetical protein
VALMAQGASNGLCELVLLASAYGLLILLFDVMIERSCLAVFHVLRCLIVKLACVALLKELVSLLMALLLDLMVLLNDVVALSLMVEELWSKLLILS